MLIHNWQRASSSARIAVALVVFLVAVFGMGSCSPAGYSGSVESITLGTVLLEPSLPLFVAEDQGYFIQNGLNVTFKIYDVGLNAATGLVNAEVDLAFPVAEYVLVGKKIGVVRGTILEFQLGRFLELNGVNTGDVTLVHGTLPQSASGLVNGDLDAVMSIPPFTASIQKQLGANAALWPAQNRQPFYSLVLAHDEWIKEHPEVVERFLMAMKQAEEFIVHHPDEAKEILRKKLNFGDEARWMINNNLTAETQVPNFLDYIYLDGLEAIRPDAVNIIR